MVIIQPSHFEMEEMETQRGCELRKDAQRVQG